MRFSLTGEKNHAQKDQNELESSGTFGQNPASPEKPQPDHKEITAFGKQLSKITGKKTSPVVQKRLSGNLSDYDPTNPDQDPKKQENFEETFKPKNNAPKDYKMDKEQEEKYELNVMNELDSFGMTPQKVDRNGSIVEDDEEDSPSKIQVFPSNQEVENALHSSGTSDKVQKISFVEEFDEEEERKYNTNESPKKMQLMPPSMTSESGSSYGHASKSSVSKNSFNISLSL